MRYAAALIVVVQLLVRAIAVPHVHGHDGIEEPPGHALHCHIHLPGRSHSLTAGRTHSTVRCCALGHVLNHEGPKKSFAVIASPPPLDHDENSLYLSDDAGAAPTDRDRALGQTLEQWFIADSTGGQADTSLQTLGHRTAAPPVLGRASLFSLRPHVLRV